MNIKRSKSLPSFRQSSIYRSNSLPALRPDGRHWFENTQPSGLATGGQYNELERNPMDAENALRFEDRNVSRRRSHPSQIEQLSRNTSRLSLRSQTDADPTFLDRNSITSSEISGRHPSMPPPMPPMQSPGIYEPQGYVRKGPTIYSSRFVKKVSENPIVQVSPYKQSNPSYRPGGRSRSSQTDYDMFQRIDFKSNPENGAHYEREGSPPDPEQPFYLRRLLQKYRSGIRQKYSPAQQKQEPQQFVDLGNEEQLERPLISSTHKKKKWYKFWK